MKGNLSTNISHCQYHTDYTDYRFIQALLNTLQQQRTVTSSQKECLHN
jgi:hypothetical protein